MLNKFAQEVHQNAVEHGWWEKEPSFPEIIALCHSELSEALEDYRAGKPLVDGICGLCQEDEVCSQTSDAFAPCGTHPEGAAVELADCILRILDYCGHAKIDIDAVLAAKHEYNKSRPRNRLKSFAGIG